MGILVSSFHFLSFSSSFPPLPEIMIRGIVESNCMNIPGSFNWWKGIIHLPWYTWWMPWYIASHDISPSNCTYPNDFGWSEAPTCGKTTHMVRAGENNHFVSQLCLIHPIYIPLIALISHSTGLKSQVAAAGAAAMAMKRFRSPVLSPKAKARHLLDFIRVPSASFSFSSRDQTESATHYQSQTTVSQSFPMSESVTLHSPTGGEWWLPCGVPRGPPKWHGFLGLVQGCLKMYWCLFRVGFRVGLRFLQGFLMVCFRVYLGLS